MAKRTKSVALVPSEQAIVPTKSSEPDIPVVESGGPNLPPLDIDQVKKFVVITDDIRTYLWTNAPEYRCVYEFYGPWLEMARRDFSPMSICHSSRFRAQPGRPEMGYAYRGILVDVLGSHLKNCEERSRSFIFKAAMTMNSNMPHCQFFGKLAVDVFMFFNFVARGAWSKDNDGNDVIRMPFIFDDIDFGELFPRLKETFFKAVGDDYAMEAFLKDQVVM